MKEHPQSMPFNRFYDLADLSAAGDEVEIVASPEDRVRLADWLDVAEVERFEAGISLSRLAPNRFGLQARFIADIVQACVVTLEPVKVRLEQEFSRVLELISPRAAKASPGELTLAAGEDGAPEFIESQRFDLAGPLLEELSLAIDPYPRAPGVAFEPPPDEGAGTSSPFAVLKKLKK